MLSILRNDTLTIKKGVDPMNEKNDEKKNDQVTESNGAEQAVATELTCPLKNGLCNRQGCSWWADTCCAMLALSDAPLALEEVKTSLDAVTETLNDFRKEFSH
jgi:hypothetical protein